MNAVMYDDGITRHRLTVEDYHRMAEVGLLTPEKRVELIDGVIIDMAPIGSRHGAAVTQLQELLADAIGKAAILRVQQPVWLNTLSEPVPDLALVKRRADHYKPQHPGAADTLLVVEVSDSSWRYDQEVKLPLYARHAIPEVWILDLNRGQMRFFHSPSAVGTYAATSISPRPGKVQLAAFPPVTVDLSGLLGG
jgi:Uma2 family endonuclease